MAAREQRWASEVEYAAFMVAREALANALLHAQAHEIAIVLAGDSGEIALAVRDDGMGLAEGALAPQPGHLGLVGMRVREHTLANEQLHQYLSTLPVPVAGWLRDTQNYVHLAARGLTLWDVAPSRVERDLEQWAPLAAWIA